jgi:glycosyltransferase involved in cell wall biosynthesis
MTLQLPAPAPISVVIPVYNGAPFLRQAIVSVLKQTLPPAELVILDNASTDGTDRVIDEFRAHPLVRTWRNEKTLPALQNWQKAIGYSQLPFFTILPADDLLGPELIKTAWAALSDHPQVGFFFCLGSEDIDERGNTVGRQLYSDPAIRGLIKQQVFLDRIAHDQFFTGQGVIIRREWFDRAGGFDPAFVHHGDYELYVRLAGVGDAYAHPGILVTNRFHSQQGRVRCYYDDEGDTERMFFKIDAYTFLSEAQTAVLVRNLRDHQFQLYSRRLRDPNASIEAIRRQREKCRATVAKMRESGLPFSRYVGRLPSRWRARMVWLVTATTPGIRLVRAMLGLSRRRAAPAVAVE